jgi:hypothetical protein
VEAIPGGYRYDPCGSCWIQESVFADKINESEYGAYLKSLGADYTYIYNQHSMAQSGVRFEALGYSDYKYFNLRSPNDFNFSYPKNFYPDSLSDEEFRAKHRGLMKLLLFEISRRKQKYRIYGKQADGSWLR